MTYATHIHDALPSLKQTKFLYHKAQRMTSQDVGLLLYQTHDGIQSLWLINLNCVEVQEANESIQYGKRFQCEILQQP